MSARTKAFATVVLASACAFANAAPTIGWSDDPKPYTDVGNGFGSRLFSSSTSTLILEEGTFNNDEFRWGTRRPDGNGTWVAATDVGAGGRDNQGVSIQPEAVPEPSRWMMMISGIGMLGAIVVRRTLMD